MIDKTFIIPVRGDELKIGVNSVGRGGVVLVPLPRETCESCGSPTCVNECDGSKGADENNSESEGEAIERQRYNAFLDGVESLALAHAAAGVDVSSPAYVGGVATAMDAATNQFLR